MIYGCGRNWGGWAPPGMGMRFAQAERLVKKIGTMKKSFLFGALALLSLGARAGDGLGDLPARPYTKAPEAFMPALYDWSGVYVGINGGWGYRASLLRSDRVRRSWVPMAATTPMAVSLARKPGYRWQIVVVGIRLRLSRVTGPICSGSNVSVLNSPLCQSFSLSTTSACSPARSAMPGIRRCCISRAARPSLPIATKIMSNGAVLASASGENRWGGTVGAGIEFSFAPNWSAALEYNHLVDSEQQHQHGHAGGNAPRHQRPHPRRCRLGFGARQLPLGRARSSRNTDRDRSI